MPQVLAWKCEHDGKLFADKGSYKRHLKKLASKRMFDRQLQHVREDREIFFDEMGQVKSIDELRQFILENWKWFHLNSISGNSSISGIQQIIVPEELDLSVNYYSFEVSNSHSCPRNGVRNWYRTNDNPRSYPGWYGKIKLVFPEKYSRKQRFYGSDYFNNTPIKTGSGGGGDISFGYDLRLYGADFPVMYEESVKYEWVRKENRKRQQSWNMIGGLNSVPLLTIDNIPDDFIIPDPLKEYSI